MKTKPNTYAALTLAMLLWSFSFIWTKQALAVYGPFTILVFRLFSAAFMLFAVSKIFGLLEPIRKEDRRFILLLSFFEPFLYFIGENLGLQYVSPTIAAVMISLIPLFMPFIGKIFFQEHVSLKNIVGLALSVCGVMLVVLEKGFVLEARVLGLALMLLAVFSALGYTTVLKKMTAHYNAFTIVSWQSLIAAIAFLPLFLVFDYETFSNTGFDFKGMKYIFLLALFASGGAFLLYTYGLRYLGVAKAAVFANLIPVFTALMSFILFHEQLGIVKMAGIALVVLGLVISQHHTRQIVQQPDYS